VRSNIWIPAFVLLVSVTVLSKAQAPLFAYVRPTATVDRVDSAVVVSSHIAEALSPGAKGSADKWDIGELAALPDVVVNVYTRYGIQVFFSKGYTKPWDGTNRKGKLLPAGTYYYVIESRSAAKKITGHVRLVE